MVQLACFLATCVTAIKSLLVVQSFYFPFPFSVLTRREILRRPTAQFVIDMRKKKKLSFLNKKSIIYLVPRQDNPGRSCKKGYVALVNGSRNNSQAYQGRWGLTEYVASKAKNFLVPAWDGSFATELPDPGTEESSKEELENPHQKQQML